MFTPLQKHDLLHAVYTCAQTGLPFIHSSNKTRHVFGPTALNLSFKCGVVLQLDYYSFVLQTRLMCLTLPVFNLNFNCGVGC